MTEEQAERTIALAEEVEAEKRLLEDKIEITGFGYHGSGVSMTTKRGDFLHKVIKDDCDPTIATFRLLLQFSIDIHARHMPKHQEYRALIAELAA